MHTNYYSLVKSIPFMGEINCNSTISSQMLVSDQNFVDHFLVRRALEFDHHECRIAHSKGKDKDEEDRHQLQSSEKKQEDNFDMFVSSLKVKIPSAGELCRVQLQDGNISGGGGVDVDDDGLKTPTSLDHKITVSLQCPPAPRKPKSLPLKKRKPITGHPRISLHFSSEIESLFPPVDDLLADLGGMIKKKVRVEG